MVEPVFYVIPVRGEIQMTNRLMAISGFSFGVLIMGISVHIFQVNHYDFDNMQRGISLLLLGINPWGVQTRIQNFYNPPFAIIFLWPMLYLSPQLMLVLGGALLFAFIFHQKAWVSLAWFVTNSALFLIAAGGIDMFVVGGGLILLISGDRLFNKPSGLVLRVLAYGLLLVKPQGTIYIVLLFILLRMDWKGVLLSLVLYGLPFIRLYPDWLHVLLTDPPLAQTIAAHTIWQKYGLTVAFILALLVISARRWKFWQLGGALAGILSPYGMPGIPILLTLGAINRLIAIPIIIFYSAGLAIITWVTPPPDVDFYAYLNPLMSIYHLSMLGLALSIACFSQSNDKQGEDPTEINVRQKLSELYDVIRKKSRIVNCLFSNKKDPLARA
jgi:hypothetical protein